MPVFEARAVKSDQLRLPPLRLKPTAAGSSLAGKVTVPEVRLSDAPEPTNTVNPVTANDSKSPFSKLPLASGSVTASTLERDTANEPSN